MTSKDLPLSDDAPPDSPFLETTVGRIIFNTALPRELRFVNDRLDKGALKRIIASVFYTEGVDTTVEVADRMKDLGMTWATRSGVTMGVQDLVIPGVKEKVLAETNALVESVEDNYSQGLITEDERYALTVKAWTDAMSTVSDSVSEYLDPLGPVYMMGNSGAAKGNFDQIRQISGMRGLMSDPSGRIIEMPVRANFREGLTVLEYFISTHGARKGLADTALRTADSGYLTRRLVDVAQDVIITGRDCGTEDGTWIATGEPGEVLDSVGDRAFGRFVLEPVVDPQTGEVLVPEDLMISRELAQAIDDAGVETVLVRSVMQCKNPSGRLPNVLRRRLGPPRTGGRRCCHRDHRGAIDGRARYPAHHAHLPPRWYRLGHGHRARAAAGGGAVRGSGSEGGGHHERSQRDGGAHR